MVPGPALFNILSNELEKQVSSVSSSKICCKKQKCNNLQTHLIPKYGLVSSERGENCYVVWSYI